MTIKVTYNVTDVYVTQDVSPVYINVSYSGGGSGGAAVWGGITGTLSNQTDLQNALNAKFDDPTGTTSQYLRGDGSLATFPAIPSGTVTSVGLTMPSAFSVANSPITSSGTLAVTATGDTTQYIAGDGSLVAFPITGQAGTLVREVRNVTGATLTKGTVVYINGASGNKPTVAKALATGDATSAQTFGLIQADIANNSNGYLVAFGDLDGLNTSAFAEGVQLYLSATTAGGYTSTKQYAPNHLVYIGVVTRQHVNQGRIEVRIQNGYEMDELHDVAAQTPSNNDGLFYNSTNSLWENKSIATALGYTPANAATTLTINGVTYDLSANRSWTVSGGISGSGAAGQVAYWTGTSAQSGSNNLFWDNTNGRLGIGTNVPSVLIDVRSNTNTTNGIFVTNSSTGNAARSLIRLLNDNGNIGQLSVWGSGNALANKTFFEATKDFVIGTDAAVASGGTSKFQVYVAGYNNATSPQLSLHSTGNLSLGSTTDSNERLQVTGNTKITGNINVIGRLTINIPSIFPSTDLGNTENTGSGGLFIGYTSGATYTGVPIVTLGKPIGFSNIHTTGEMQMVVSSGSFAPTSGTGTFVYHAIRGTINQTGGANGITRGLYVNPTLTAAADFRAIETTNGKVIFGNLPTSSAGLPTGAIWNDAGTIKIV